MPTDRTVIDQIFSDSFGYSFFTSSSTHYKMLIGSTKTLERAEAGNVNFKIHSNEAYILISVSLDFWVAISVINCLVALVFLKPRYNRLEMEEEAQQTEASIRESEITICKY